MNIVQVRHLQDKNANYGGVKMTNKTRVLEE